MASLPIWNFLPRLSVRFRKTIWAWNIRKARVAPAFLASARPKSSMRELGMSVTFWPFLMKPRSMAALVMAPRRPLGIMSFPRPGAPRSLMVKVTAGTSKPLRRIVTPSRSMVVGPTRKALRRMVRRLLGLGISTPLVTAASGWVLVWVLALVPALRHQS